MTMPIKFADQKIREARQRITALDREMNELSGHARFELDAPSQEALRELREHHLHLREERKKAYFELLQLLDLDETHWRVRDGCHSFPKGPERDGLYRGSERSDGVSLGRWSIRAIGSVGN